MVGYPQLTGAPLFQATWSGASTRDDPIQFSTRSQSAFGGPGARYAASNKADHLHSFLFNELAPVLILMLYSALNHRLGYRFPDKASAGHGKAGVLPHWMIDLSVFLAFWQALTIEVNRLTMDLEGVNHMMALAADVSDMMALPYGASQREADDAWLLACHRILFRLDLMLHHADLAYLSMHDPKELTQSKLRVQALSTMAGRASSSVPSYRESSRDNRPFKKPRSGADPRGGGFLRPLQYCEFHKKQVRHAPADCYLRPRSSDSGK